MKSILLILLTLFAFPIGAEVGFLSVTNEDVHSKKEDFWHTFEYFIVSPGQDSAKCQATRISKKWFATAAHCVASRCNKDCEIRIDLLEQDVSAMAVARHTVKKPLVFVHPKYGRKEFASHDFALLHIDLSKTSMLYYAHTQKQRLAISRRQFEWFLNKNYTAKREYNQIFRPKLPPILIFHKGTYQIARELSVISIFDGKREIMHSPFPAEYVQELGFAYTKNFGVRKGMSGSGVMTNTGELAGIVSGDLSQTINGKKQTTELAFAVFNEDLRQFMEDTMGDDYYKMDRHYTSDGYVKRSRTDHSIFIRRVKSALTKEFN